MNMGYTITVIIGAAFLISVVILKNNMFRSSYESTFHIVTNNEIDNIRQLITHDLRYVGFGRNSELIHFSDSLLHFRAVVDGNLADFSWGIVDGPGTYESNPNLVTLERTGPAYDGTTVPVTNTFRVSRFQVFAFGDEHGNHFASIADDVRSIWIELEVMSAEAIGQNPDGSAQYAVTRWNKLYRPSNLNM